MGSLLSAISGQFAKVVALGTLFPVLIISILNVVLVTPMLPNAGSIQAQLKRIAVGDDKWSAVALTFVVVVLTGVLYNLNIPIIRLYEGYPWRDSWLGAVFVYGKKKELRQTITLRLAIRNLRRYLLKVSPADDRLTALGTQQTALAVILNTEMPSNEAALLPTRLGNVIRCFEMYSSAAYGIDAIVLWPRLLSKIDSAFASTIDEAKASFDFMLNCSFLSVMSALGIVTIGLSRPAVLSWPQELPWIRTTAFFGLLGIVFYHFSIGRAKAWGEQVKAAFDLYRLPLLNALGYQQQPLSYLEEIALWSKISSQLLYPDSKESPVPYKDLPSRVVASPPGVELKVTREYGQIEANAHVLVRLTIENCDRARRLAVVTKLVESVPDGFKYVPQTAQVSDGFIRVSNMAPLEFIIDPIRPGATVVVCYDIKAPA
jgi:hypothetical protein